MTSKTSKTSEAVTLTADQRKMVTDIIAAEVKVEAWQSTAGQRWFAANTVEGEMTDQKTNTALCTLYCDKKIAAATAAKGEALTDDENADVVRRSKNIWKNRRKEVRSAVESSADQLVEGNQRSTVKGEDERRADAVGALRRWFGANDKLTDDDIIAAWRDATGSADVLPVS